MPKLSKSPSSRTFTELFAEEVLQKAARGNTRGAAALAKDSLDAFGQPIRTADQREAFVTFAKDRASQAVSDAAGDDGRLSTGDADNLPKDLRLAYHYLKTGELPSTKTPGYSKRYMQDALRDNGLTDDDIPALLALAASTRPSDSYLNRAELQTFASQLAHALPELARLIPGDWRAVLTDALQSDSFKGLDRFVRQARSSQEVYPPAALTFAALNRTPLQDVKVVLLGQDPYHGEGEATGLSFSLPVGVRVPSSLRNIYRELGTDLGVTAPNHGNLEDWASQGVLLLNTVLTVEKDKAGSHRREGWEDLTDAMLREIDKKDERVVFLLLGADARKKTSLIDQSKHTIVTTTHPSGLSARHGFFGSKVFSAVNDALRASGQDPINWQLQDR